VSALFALWSLTGFVLEVPSGALADATSRRALLVVAQLLTAAAFAVWVLAPSFAAFALGFALWGVAGALQSGALEALAYEELGTPAPPSATRRSWAAPPGSGRCRRRWPSGSRRRRSRSGGSRSWER